MTTMRGCPGRCAMHHECPCADKLERHPQDGVADTPGTRRSPDAVPGRQLEEAVRRLRLSEERPLADSVAPDRLRDALGIPAGMSIGYGKADE